MPWVDGAVHEHHLLHADVPAPVLGVGRRDPPGEQLRRELGPEHVAAHPLEQLHGDDAAPARLGGAVRGLVPAELGAGLVGPLPPARRRRGVPAAVLQRPHLRKGGVILAARRHCETLQRFVDSSSPLPSFSVCSSVRSTEPGTSQTHKMNI